jgi:hypothetical protein
VLRQFEKVQKGDPKIATMVTVNPLPSAIMGADRQKWVGWRRALAKSQIASGNCVAASRTFNSRECKSKQHAQECRDESIASERARDGWMDGDAPLNVTLVTKTVC